MNSSRLLFVAVACAALAGMPAHADVIDIAWSADGRFEHRAELAPGGFAEVCGRLEKGRAVRWAFDAGGPLDFNIHYHEGQQVVFPVQRRGAAKGAATLKVKLGQDYCWMWTNRTAQPLALRLTLDR
jgi:hypothetical protein